MKFFKPMKTTTYMLLITGLVFVVTGVFVIGFVHYSMRQYARVEAEAKHKIILNRALATHSYFSQNLKPKLFKWSEAFQGEEYFEPSWMSSTYAIRHIGKYFNSLNASEYYFKDAAINARSPENEADQGEREFIQRLNSDPKLRFESDIRLIDGKPYFTTISRGEEMDESCLRCHSVPTAAPSELVSLYGAERSFQRKEGETISAVSIRIPLSAAYENVDQIVLEISTVITMALLVLLGVMFFLTKLFLINPLGLIRDGALKISADKKNLGETIRLTTPGKELNAVVSAFNSMSTQLRGTVETLDLKVTERTSELNIANENLLQEITERKSAGEQLEVSLKEKETLLQEIHHRVKNNMAVISSLLTLQARQLKEETAIAVLHDCQNRVQTMSLIHETLYQTNNLSLIDMSAYFTKLVNLALQSYGENHQRVHCKIEADQIKLDVKTATSLGLIVNELITNSLKHAFPNNQSGECLIGLNSSGQDTYELRVADNGIGFVEDFEWKNADTLGLKLVNVLVENQLDGTILLERALGTKFIIGFHIDSI